MSYSQTKYEPAFSVGKFENPEMSKMLLVSVSKMFCIKLNYSSIVARTRSIDYSMQKYLLVGCGF